MKMHHVPVHQSMNGFESLVIRPGKSAGKSISMAAAHDSHAMAAVPVHASWGQVMQVLPSAVLHVTAHGVCMLTAQQAV